MLMIIHHIIIGNTSPAIHELIQTLNSRFPLKDLGDLNFFLCTQVKKTDSGGLYLTQTKYIQYLLSKANMITANPMKTPMVSSVKLTAHDTIEAENPSLYRSIVVPVHAQS